MGLLGIAFIIVYAIILRPKKQAALKESGNVIQEHVPWKTVLTNGVLWQFFLIVFGLSSVTKGLDSWMPTYLLAARHINLAGISWLVPLPSLAAGAGSLISGYIMARFFKGKEKLFIGVSSLLATGLMFGMYKSTALPAVITFEILTYFCKSIAFAGTFALFAELVSKKAYGSSVGIVNFGGQLSDHYWCSGSSIWRFVRCSLFVFSLYSRCCIHRSINAQSIKIEQNARYSCRCSRGGLAYENYFRYVTSS